MLDIVKLKFINQHQKNLIVYLIEIGDEVILKFINLSKKAITGGDI